MDGYIIIRNNYRMFAGLKARQYDYDIGRATPAEGQEEALVAVREFSFRFIDNENPIGLLLVGGVGSGKTFMVSGVVNDIIREMEISEHEANNAQEKTITKGISFWRFDRPNIIPVHFISVTEMINQLKACISIEDNFEDYSSWLIKTLQEVSLLVLDDLGAEKPSDWVREKLFEIIDYRYNEHLPMQPPT